MRGAANATNCFSALRDAARCCGMYLVEVTNLMVFVKEKRIKYTSFVKMNSYPNLGNR